VILQNNCIMLFSTDIIYNLAMAYTLYGKCNILNSSDTN